MPTLQGYVSTVGEYPSDGSNEILSAEISDTSTPNEPGIVYANPEVPYSIIQDLATGAGGQKQSSGGGGINSKQLVVYNDPRAARQAIQDLGLKATLLDITPPPPTSSGTDTTDTSGGPG